jgi:WD40 repeat protein
MELLTGESLDDRLKREERLPEGEVLRIGREIAEGLAAAHARGLVHRDIKPANIWLEEPRGRVKIVDFGLAHASRGDVELTQEGALLGTPAYMSPEQAQGAKIDARADLFSLGCVLYRMCTGKAPFEGTDTIALLYAAATREPIPPKQHTPEVSSGVSDFILRLLAKDPAKRPVSADEAAALLRRLEAGDALNATPSRRSLGRKLLAAAAILVLVLGPLAAFFGGTVIRFATNKGVLVVEIDDPTLRIEIEQNELVVRDKTLDREFTLTAMDGQVRVFEKAGVEFTTKRFTLKRGVTTRLTVTAEEVLAIGKHKTPGKEPGKLGPVLPSTFPPDAIEHWQAARWKAPEELVAVLGESRQRMFDEVLALVFSPDGKHLAGKDQEGNVYVWQTDGMKCVWVLNNRQRGSIGFLNGGKILATTGATELSFWHVPTFEHAGKLDGVDAVRFAASADGQRCAILSRAGEVSIWDVSKPKPLSTQRFKLKDAASKALALSADGRIVAVVEGESLLLWEPDTGKTTRISDSVAKGSVNLAFSNDGKILLANNSSGAGRALRLGDDKAFWQQSLNVNGLAISPDATLLAVGYARFQAAVYSLAPKSERTVTLPAFTKDVRSVAFSPDGKLLATGGQSGATCLWEVGKDGLTERAPLEGHHSHVQRIHFSADGKWLVSAGYWDRLVRVWRWDGAKTAAFADLRHTAYPPTIDASLSPDGSQILSVVGSGDEKLNHFSLWPLEEKRAPTSKDAYSFGKDGRGGMFLAGSKRLALITSTGVRLWDLPSSNVPQPGKLLEGTAGCAALDASADGKVIVAALPQPKGGLRVSVFRAKSSSDDYTLHASFETRSKHLAPPGRVIVSSDGRYAGVAGYEGIWDISGATPKSIGFDKGRFGVADAGFAFSPDAKKIAFAETSSAGSHVKIFDIQKSVKDPETIWKLPDRCTGSPVYSPDGQYLVTPNGNGTLYVFRVPGAKP